MNVDLNALSLALHQAATNTAGTKGSATMGTGSGDTKLKSDAPPTRRVVVRQRSKGSRSSSTLQFLEAAHRSWTCAQEDLPSGEGALERRKSSRSKVNGEIGHMSWTLGEKPKPIPEDESICSATLLMTASSKVLPPHNKTQQELPLTKGSSARSTTLPRRASIAGSIVAPPNPVTSEEDEEEEALKDECPATPMKKGGKLTRRSSFQVVASRRKNNNDRKSLLLGEDLIIPANDPAAAGPPPVSPSGPRIRGKMARRNTIHSCSNAVLDGPAPQTRSPKQSRRSSMKIQAANRSVRFELDHKHRIKRHVSFIRSQTSYRTDTRALWWSEEDLDRIYQRENRVYEKFSNDRRYKKAIRKLWGICSKAASVPPDAKIITHVAGAPSRGLEVDILETVRDRRARIIGRVLDAQEALQEFDPVIRAKVLSARYKNQCKAATRFAQKMGEGDALEAANVYSN
jgi:hypothetical protein